MAKSSKLITSEVTIGKLSDDESVKGIVFTEWDILFEKSPSKPKLEQTIADLLEQIGAFKPEDKSKTTSLKYRIFRSEENKLLYVLRVYRQSKSPRKSNSSAKSGNNADPSIVKAATVISGPIRTPGPPPPPPPAGVSSISNEVGLTEALTMEM